MGNNTPTRTTTTPSCPSCGGRRGREVKMARLYECTRCRCLHGTLTRGESYEYVLPRMKAADASIKDRPYDLQVLCGNGSIERRHGFYDPADKFITQVG